MSNEIVQVKTGPTFLAPAGSADDFLQAYQLKKEIVSKILISGTDYGTVPGATKPTLLKSGAEKMTNFYALTSDFLDVETIEDWTGKEHNDEPFFYYRQKCNLYKYFPDGTRILVASADGSCNSWEKKYRYRQADRVCTQCGKPAIIKGKEEYGGGWLCYAKKGGCGAKYADNDPTIINQEVGQIKNPDVAELVNTLLKMAQKRALIAATLIATNTSDYFTQDLEDFGYSIINAEVKEINPANIDQETGEVVPPVELVDPMGEWAVVFAAKEWNVDKANAAKEIAKKKLGKQIGKDDFIALVKGE